MVQIVSCGRNTILHEFPSLKTLSSYEHKDNDKHDFQFFSNNKLFLKLNKKSEIEFLRIKQSKEEDEIGYLRKVRLENIFCIACPKKSRNDFAVGLTSGHIKLVNYKTSEIVQKFNPDLQNNSVAFLDYSICDEYLAGVYENGNINVFGLKTGVKLNKLTFDEKNLSMIARFHPVKKLQLAIGSYSGNVSIYDLQTKRISFTSSDAHDAPCRDVCMSSVHPDCLITAGYDSVINIFDLRKKTQACQITQKHPLSSICLSNCGNFCCAGDLKGEITCYDFRNLKVILNSMKIHDGNISRVSFVPQTECLEKSVNTTKDIRKSSSNNQRISLIENIDNAVSQNRDSFWDDVSNFHQKRNADFSPTTRLSMASRFSIDSRASHGMGIRNFLSLLESSGDVSIDVSSDDFDNCKQKKNDAARQNSLLDICKQPKKTVRKSDLFIKTHLSKSEILEEIVEECITIDENQFESKMEKAENKENICVNLNNSHKDGIESFTKLPDNKNSTPHQPTKNSTNIEQTTLNILSDKIDLLTEKIQIFEMKMDEKFIRLNNEIKTEFSNCILKNYSGTFNLLQYHEDTLKELTNGVGLLLRDEPFVQHYAMITNENILLREEINELKKNQRTK